MLKTKNQGVVFKILFCIFVAIMVVLVLISREVIDLIYLGLVFILVFKFLIENLKK